MGVENLIFWRLLLAQVARAFFYQGRISCTQLGKEKNRLEIPKKSKCFPNQSINQQYVDATEKM